MPSATSYNTVGNREDILDIVATVDPEATPMFSSLAKTRSPKALNLEWQADVLDNPTFAGVVDGTDVSTFDNKASGRVRLGNRVQTFRRPYQVTRLQEMVETAGVPSEYGRSKGKAITELKIDIESALGSDNESQIGSGAQPDLLRGLGKWIDSSNANIDSSIRTPSGSEGTTSTLTEALYNTAIQSTYEASGKTASFRQFSGPDLQNKITNFARFEGASRTSALQVVTDSTTKELVFSITRYVSDFGTIDVIPDLFLARTEGAALATAGKQRGYLINSDMVSVSLMENPNTFELEDQGAGRRGFAEAVLTLCVKNPKALGKFSG